jgi:hypothetical protein
LNDAAFAGDILAMRNLYQHSKRNEIAPLAEFWSLKGSLAGDPELTKAYIGIYRKQLNLYEKDRMLKVVKSSVEKKAAACLFALMADDSRQRC